MDDFPVEPLEFSDRFCAELACTTNVLLRDIANEQMKRNAISKLYALALRSSGKTDWRKVNEAIIKRWSRYALEYIKTRAHNDKCFDSAKRQD